MDVFSSYPFPGNSDCSRVPVQLLAYNGSSDVLVSFQGNEAVIPVDYLSDAAGRRPRRLQRALFSLPEEVGGARPSRREVEALLKKARKLKDTYILYYCPKGDSPVWHLDSRRKIFETTTVSDALALFERLLTFEWAPPVHIWLTRCKRTKYSSTFATILSADAEEGVNTFTDRNRKITVCKKVTRSQARRIALAYERATAKLAKASATPAA